MISKKKKNSINQNIAYKKLLKLESLLAPYRKVILAFSGGVDSTFLLAVLCKNKTRKVIAITALSPTYPQRQRKQAKKLAKQLGSKYQEISTDEINLKSFQHNPPNRCYYCKHELFTRLNKIRKQKRYDITIDGSNYDDLFDFRPGLKALQELGILSPLKEAKLTKAEIRFLSKKMHLQTWNKPAFACLSSRFPYGTTISKEALHRIDACEDFLVQKLKGPVRIRFYDSLARIEVSPEMFPLILKQRTAIIKHFKKQGFDYITLDIEGYRTGSMNEVL